MAATATGSHRAPLLLFLDTTPGRQVVAIDP